MILKPNRIVFTGGGTHINFLNLQREKEDEKKMLATKLALNWLKLNRWDSSSADYTEIYETAWIEKMMLVETAYGVAEIRELSKSILQGQRKLLADVGLIVSRTGEILKNQEVIINNQGEILLIVTENLEVSYEILGNVQDIKATVEDMANNGIIIKKNDYKGGSAGGGSMMKYLIIGAIVLGVIIYFKKKKKKK